MKPEKKKAVIAYAGEKQVYELETIHGKKVRASAGHRLYIKRESRIYKKDIANLRKGDKLICLQE